MESSCPALLDRGYKAHRQGGSKPGQGVTSRRSWTWSPATSGPAALHAGHNIRQEAVSVLLSDLREETRARVKSTSLLSFGPTFS